MYPLRVERARLPVAFRLTCFAVIGIGAALLSSNTCATAAPLSTSTFWADQPGVLLRTAADARGLGLGGVALSDGISAAVLHAQPAGLTGLNGAAATVTRLDLPADLHLDGFFYAQSLARATRPDVGDPRWDLGIGLLRLSSGGIPQTSEDGAQIGTFSYTSGLFLLGLAYQAPRSPVSWGVTGKALLQQFDLRGGTARGSGIGLDLGVTYEVRPAFQLSAGLQNVGGLSVGWTSGEVEQADPVYRGGFVWQGRERSAMEALTLASEWIVSSKEWRGGLEYHVAEGLALRFGLDRGEPTVGIGVDLGTVHLDYAFLTRVPAGGDPMDSGYVMGIHAVSVGVAF